MTRASQDSLRQKRIRPQCERSGRILHKIPGSSGRVAPPEYSAQRIYEYAPSATIHGSQSIDMNEWLTLHQSMDDLIFRMKLGVSFKDCSILK